ncbi:MAG: methyltransferase [Verrucomicrobiales bacterium]|jgi:16S rRNA (guanine966-N2)-methyltransferase|nr:methyltransferase [Verrucomicrobiales bacterium]
MRIIGGMAAGRLIDVPKGFDVRPTPDLVRQAIFNSIGHLVEGARVLDLFSGSGALGLECLSRGAGSVLSIEKANRHAMMIRQNIVAVELPLEKYQLRVQDVFISLVQLAEAKNQFDLITADPPFGEKNVGRRSTSMSQKLLDNEHLPKLLTPEGLLVLGHTKRDTLEIPPTWEEVKVMKHGDSMMNFLKLKT